MMNLVDQLILHEGMKLEPYKCTAGKTTIGVGRNLEGKGLSKLESIRLWGRETTKEEALALIQVGITDEEALYLLHNDIRECADDLSRLFGAVIWFGLSTVRKNALIDLRLNLGPNRFRKFKKMISAVKDGNYVKAAEEMWDSQWRRQVGFRAVDLYNMMIAG